MPLLATIGTAAEQAYGIITYAKDQFFNFVVTLISGSGTNAANNNLVYDTSSNNYAVTKFNNAAPGTFTPFSRVAGLWGVYFGGLGNYCSYAGAALATTASTFTVESWIYMSATPGANPTLIGDMQPTGTTLNWSFGPNSAGKVVFLWFDGAAKSAVGTTVMSLNRWYHIAVSVNANAITMYVNGSQETLTGTTTLTNRAGTTSTVVLGQAQSSSFYFIGYAYNLSILAGTAKYSGNFTPQTTPLPTNATNQAFLVGGYNNLFDANTTTSSRVVTITGSLMRATTISLIPNSDIYAPLTKGGSISLDGAADYLSVAGNSNLAFGTGDFTIECFVYMQSLVGFIYDSRTAGSQITPCIYITGGTIIYYVGGAARITSATVITNQWYHLVVSRVSGNTRMFLNGTQTGSTYVDANNYINNTNRPFIGANGDTTSSFFFGYISNVRVLKGEGTTAPTVPTAPLTAIPNTQLLLSGISSGIYDATGYVNIETAGAAAVSNALIKYGNGSLIFNGTTSYLKLTAPIATGGTLIAPVGDFTVEGWVNVTSLAAQRTFCYFNGNNTAASACRLQIETTGALTLLMSTNGTTWTINTASATGRITVGTWAHIAIVRTVGNVYVYVNGTRVITSTALGASTALMSGFFNVFGAVFNSTYQIFFLGYMSNLRVTQVARYTTTTFTPPTGAFPVQG
jgi:hypothetical protein